MNLSARTLLFLIAVVSAADFTHSALAQGNAPALPGSSALPPVVEGLRAAEPAMNEEAYTQCLAAGLFISNLARTATIKSTDQLLADAMEAFTCDSSKPVLAGTYYVLGTIEVSGDSHPYEAHMVETENPFRGGTSWTFSYLEISGSEVYRRKGFEPVFLDR